MSSSQNVRCVDADGMDEKVALAAAKVVVSTDVAVLMTRSLRWVSSGAHLMAIAWRRNARRPATATERFNGVPGGRVMGVTPPALLAEATSVKGSRVRKGVSSARDSSTVPFFKEENRSATVPGAKVS